MLSGKKRLSPINSILTKDSEILSGLCARAAVISNLQRKLCADLGPPLSDHLRVANFNNETLILYTDSPAWAARLRFKIPDILKCAQAISGSNKLRTIRIKVDIPPSDSNETKKRISLSTQTAELIRQTAATITDDSLRSILQRLSCHK